MSKFSKTIDDISTDLSQAKREQITEVTQTKQVTDKPAENTEFQQSTEKLDPTTSDKIEKVGQWARKGILKAEERAEQAEASKKKIIRLAAKKLEGKVTTNTIAMRLAELLHGLVSDRHIRECLEDKYKQEYRAVNARKQVNEKLAALAPLEQQFTSENMVEKNNGIVVAQNPYPPTTRADVLEALEALNKSTDNKAGTELGSDRGNRQSNVTFYPVTRGLRHKKNEELHLFSFPWRAISDYMQSIFKKHGSNQEVAFHLVIDTNTRKPITAGFGLGVTTHNNPKHGE